MARLLQLAQTELEALRKCRGGQLSTQVELKKRGVGEFESQLVQLVAATLQVRQAESQSWQL
jgi:hypothetical protein